MYHFAALERGADSINGVDTQGLGSSGGGRLPILEDIGAGLRAAADPEGREEQWPTQGYCNRDIRCRREEESRREQKSSPFGT